MTTLSTIDESKGAPPDFYTALMHGGLDTPMLETCDAQLRRIATQGIDQPTPGWIDPADTKTEIGQDFGDAAHPGATNADEMDVLDLVFHVLHTSSQTRATVSAASGRASSRARSAICSSWLRV